MALPVSQLDAVSRPAVLNDKRKAMPLLPGENDEVIGENIRTLRNEGRPEAQAVAIAMEHAKKKKPVSLGSSEGYDTLGKAQAKAKEGLKLTADEKRLLEENAAPGAESSAKRTLGAKAKHE